MDNLATPGRLSGKNTQASRCTQSLLVAVLGLASHARGAVSQTSEALTIAEEERDECDMWLRLPSMFPPWIR